MRPKVTLELSQEAYDELVSLSDTIGFSPEMAMMYAVRLVNACIREGLLTDTPSRAWPKEAQADDLFDTGTGGKVIAFPARKELEERKE